MGDAGRESNQWLLIAEKIKGELGSKQPSDEGEVVACPHRPLLVKGLGLLVHNCGRDEPLPSTPGSGW